MYIINQEWGHNREISDWGLDVLTATRLRSEIIFPAMTEQTRLKSYLLYAFTAILKMNTIKNTGSIFNIRT